MTPRIPRGWVRWQPGTVATGQPWYWSKKLRKWKDSAAHGEGDRLGGWFGRRNTYIIPAPGSRKRNPNRKDGGK